MEALAGQGAPFALVGGLAVSARTEPRFTRDIDLVVAVENDREAEAVVRALAPSYEVLVTLEHDALQRLAAVRVGRRALPPPRRWSTCCSRPRG
ncbi:MAG: nucleotidyl transferase AbiEii/AbiGii toxin family protein [Actinomycetota bacterium]|nr:nucleotidyl transferase AbiEii/AbiGii toxin family protein [Actinomycetota bacterium]